MNTNFCLDGRISKNETQTLDDLDSLHQDCGRKDDICPSVKISRHGKGNSNDDTATAITLEGEQMKIT